MSRSGYIDSDDWCGSEWQIIIQNGQLQSSIKGKRGQTFFRDFLKALDAMPEKRLITEELRNKEGVCALGSVGAARGIELESLDPYDYDKLSEVFNIAPTLIRQIEWMNDDDSAWCTPEQRWQRVRDWAAKQIRSP